MVKQPELTKNNVDSNFLTEVEKTEIIANGYLFKEHLNKELQKGILSYHFKSKTEKYPSQVVIFWLGQSSAERWKAKAYKYSKVAERPMDREERIQNHIAYRERCSYYISWKALIDDEQEIGAGDAAFFEALEKASKLFPLLETKPAYQIELLSSTTANNQNNQLELF